MRILLPVLALGLFLISACKKDNTNTGANAGMLKSMTSQEDGVKWEYTYDNDGRLTHISGTDGSHTELTYSTGKIVRIDYPFTGAGVYDTMRYTYFLNADSLADSSTFVSTYNSLTSTKNYYNTDGYLIKAIEYNSGTIFADTFEIQNGNYVLRHNATGFPGHGQITYTYTNTPNSISTGNQGQAFLGKDSKNLVASSTENGGDVDNFTYTYDAQNRAITQADTRNSSATYHLSYTYY